MQAHLVIALLGTLPLLVMPFVAVPEASNYRFSFALLIPILWGAYAARHWLRLHAFHFALFALALTLHDLGALGCYANVYWGLAFDTYVHFFFGIVGGLVLARAFREAMSLRPWQVGVATILFVLGLGAIHELVEFASTMALGPKTGMYKIGNADEFDTQKDLFNNLLGSALALGLSSASRRRGSRRALREWA